MMSQLFRNIKTIIAQRRLPAFDSGRHARLTYRPASGRPTAGRQVGLDRGRRPGGRRNGGFGGQRPPTENLNDFHDDYQRGRWGREAGGTGGSGSAAPRQRTLMISIMICRRGRWGREAGGKIQKFQKLLLLQQQQQPAFRPDFFSNL